MSKFKVGDKVKIISSLDNSEFINKVGEVLAIPYIDSYYEVSVAYSMGRSTLWLENELIKEQSWKEKILHMF